MAGNGGMMHKRIWLAIVSRDWFGVGVEVFAVVLGVLLGLQASQWADARQEARERAELLDRLANDLTKFATDNDLIAKSRAERIANLQWLESRRLAHDVEAADPETLYKAVDSAFTYDDVRPLPISFTEMLESGSLRRLEDKELRKKLELLARFHARHQISEQHLNRIGIDESQRYEYQFITRRVKGNAPLSGPIVSDDDSVDYDYSRLLDSQVNVAAVYSGLGHDLIVRGMQRDMILLSYDRGTAKIARDAVEQIEKD